MIAPEWTTTPPTEPGLYWHRRIDKTWLDPTVVEVSSYGEDGLYVHELGVTECAPLSQWRGEWAGPLQPPETP